MKKQVVATRWPRQAPAPSVPHPHVNDDMMALAQTIGEAAHRHLAENAYVGGVRYTFSYETPINRDIRMLVTALHDLYGDEFVETDGYHHTFIALRAAS